MHLRSHYFDDPAAKSAFKNFALEIFGLDFTGWEERGLWDDAYVPYSLFEGTTVVANMCLYPSVMTVRGRIRKGLELLTVGTLPAWRRRGLQRQIWEAVLLEEVPQHDFVFLFTEFATGFYEKLGLQRQPEYFHRLAKPVRSSFTTMGNRKLDPDDPGDYRILSSLVHHRVPVSQTLGFQNPNLLLFMLVGPYRDWLYYLPGFDLIIVVEPSGDSIRIHDIVGRSMPGLASIESFLAQFQPHQVDLLFSPDQLGPVETADLPLTEDALMTSVGFSMPAQTLFPFSIRA
jgi:GNAT superfamily N-acetyltransferase